MSFDTLAPHYRWMERVLAGEKLQACRIAHLRNIDPPQRALLAGEGHGRFLRAFIVQFPKTEITCLDASHRMLDHAKSALTTGSVTFLHVDILDAQLPENHFDLIVTNFFLDCFPPDQLARVINKLARSATPQATWLLADFCQAPCGWKKLRTQWILATMYFFFRLATHLPARRLTPPDDLLHNSGFELISRTYFEWQLLHADLWRRTIRPQLH
jgi:ubiquinone/menaquinone biosynthesis C-methylase UbiE